MKQLVLTALLAAQSTVAGAAQTGNFDISVSAEDSPSRAYVLAAADGEQKQQKSNNTEKQADEEPDCD